MTDTTSGVSPSLVGDDDKKCPICGRKEHSKKYRRDQNARKETLLRDAADPDSDLSDSAREAIKKSGGEKVPKGYQVSHKKPLATEPDPAKRCKLDKPKNMETIPKAKHRQGHRRCGTSYHRWGI